MVVLVACSSFMVPIEPADSPVVTSSCRTYRKTIFRTLQRLVLWFVLATLKPWNFYTKMCRILFPSSSVLPLFPEKALSFWWQTFLLSKPVSSHGLPVKSGVKMSLPRAAISTAPLQARCSRSLLRSTASMAISDKKAKSLNLPSATEARSGP